MDRNKPVLITPEGLERLLVKLDYLTSVRRVEIADQLHEAQSGGDTIDNTEFQTVQYEQLLLEMQIKELQRQIALAQLIDKGNGDGIITIGSTVVIQGGTEPQESYLLVGSTEANPGEGRISVDCPLGKELLNRRTGEVITVNSPDGAVEYSILAVD
jgi:transcription elongation factor GreA